MCVLVVLGIVLGIGAAAVFSQNAALAFGMAFLGVLMGIIAIVGGQALKAGSTSDYRSEYELQRSRINIYRSRR